MKTKQGFTIQRSTIIAGVGNSISMFGGPKNACIAHCEDVAAKINALGL